MEGREETVDIVVLLKQVPATESLIRIADDGMSVKTEDVKWVINPYDEFAVEEALRIKEAHGGSVTIVSVGPEKAVEAIRTALAMGADQGVLINDPAVAGLDALGIAQILAAALQHIPFDLIISGQRAVDDDNFQVGPATAEFLGIPHISMVIKQAVSDAGIRCHRTVEGGIVVVEAPLPALFTTQRGLNEPRYASLPGIMKAKKKPVAMKTLSDIGLDVAQIRASRVRTVAIKPPPERKDGIMIPGDTAREKASVLIRRLHEEEKVI